MPSEPKHARIQPRLIIHGGAGNIHRSNLPQSSYAAYRTSLLSILNSSKTLLQSPSATALDVATHAVTLLENDPLFNAGHGAVFTRAGTNELEASVMVSDGHHKRGVGCMLLTHVKNPIKLAREMLLRGDELDGGGAQAHCQLSGPYLEDLARKWGLDIVEQEYFWTRKRWEEHERGLEREKGGSGAEKSKHAGSIDDGDPSWDGHEYLPQGTVGCVVLDSFGTICAATSTGGLTNKLPGRIGDTPTIGAGFWAEEWFEEAIEPQMLYQNPGALVSAATSPLDKLSRGELFSVISDCLPLSTSSEQNRSSTAAEKQDEPCKTVRRHAVGMSGTGNGDSFLRVNAVRTAAAISRFTAPNLPLATALKRVAGPGGELQRSAGERWGKTGEGEGGIIGIELVGTEGKVVFDLNCGGMFRAWVDDAGEERFEVFRDE
ncbi:N-terminal nucleophile aminohydrolase [Saccharata proteae CBS 121410]|uniref:N-terminal nucleophile aminohydrolase n=1 Tax=Saccharata proteae CBS 121410 TaxID=1314787 RepID=A0A9P4HZ86_9PEZI|nr:N-terminal nucleophile aminohydrolase [Saccharata proteae CBS 121410]